VIGQDEAITAIAKSVRRSRAGLKDPKRPIGVFMFLGPTGVGKTYLPRVLAEFMFGSEDNMIKLDMSEFMEKHNVWRLVGGALGFNVPKNEAKTVEDKYVKMKEKVTEDLKRVFRPEFLNRIDGQVVFHPLAREHIRQIVELQLRELEKQLLLKGVSVEMTDAA